jgi:hypothetical protein
MFGISSTLVVALFGLIVIGILLFLWRTDRNRYRNANQQQVLNTSETLSSARRRVLEELFEKVEVQSNNLFMGAMSHVTKESAQMLANLAQSINNGNSNPPSPNGSGGTGGVGNGGASNSSTAQSTQSTSSSTLVPQQAPTARSARSSTAAQDLFKSASGNTPHPWAG